ncbi:MAG: alpha/beta hydrolase fold domain-containing protein [Hyphomicrobiales bacterium]|nr:alpha/beta hydrolase fold domain-containing protein [Hyphomicrobiales bacterium]
MTFRLSALACAAVLVASAAPQAQAASGQIHLQSGGVRRSAFIVERDRLKQAPRMTIVVLHGQNGRGLRARKRLALEDKLRSRGTVLVYPDALGGQWGLEGAAAERDRKFIADLIGRLEADHITDRKRVFLLGVSTGGALAANIACAQTHTFAGAAVVIGAATKSVAAACKPSKPLPFLMISAVSDPLVPYAGGRAALADYKGELASAEATLAPFRAAAGCSDVKKTVDLPDKDPRDGSRAYRESWQGCRAPVELVRIEGGGHFVPGAARIDRVGGEPGPAPAIHNNDIDAPRIVLDFFRHPGG